MDKQSKDIKPVIEVRKSWYRKPAALFGLIVGIFLVLIAVYAAYAYAATPQSIRKPAFDHVHFRMQIVINNKAEDLSQSKFQQTYEKGQCSNELSDEPIHLHDGRDQLVHLHWRNLTGGQVLKYYGWNYIGGMPNALGYQALSATNYKKIPIRGNLLPSQPPQTQLHVYVGNETSYAQKNSNDFLRKDIETFFGIKSNIPSPRSGLLNTLFPTAYASSGIHSEDENDKLQRVNNLVGNVVIFAQAQEPSDEQIKARFADLLPLTLSTCGG